MDLYRDILKSVSRSFYLSLRILPAPMRPVMGMGYLMCRTADTIADTKALPVKDRLQMLSRFKNLFTTFPIPPQPMDAFVQDLVYANTIPSTSEGKLLNHFKQTATAFNHLSRTDQALIQEVVLAVIQGMEIDLQTFGDSEINLQSFKTEDDLENYIRLIGGEPGRFWAKVCLNYGPPIEFKRRDEWIEDGIRFGTGLQMVNILRDIPEDLKNGRCYIPEDLLKENDLTLESFSNNIHPSRFRSLYHKLIDNTLDRFDSGMTYIDQLPENNFRLKAAVWWPLAIGLKTLGKLRKSSNILTRQKRIKVSRWEIYLLMASSLLTLTFRKQMRRDYNYLVSSATSSIE